MDNLVKLEILGITPSQAQAGSFALILGDEQQHRRLPIIIGVFEAQAIAIEIEKFESKRPFTHDLFKSFAKAFDYDVTSVVISDLRDGIFYAKINCKSAEKELQIDARTSDAIAIALRFKVSIYTYEHIMSEAGILLSDIERAEQRERQAEKQATDEDEQAQEETGVSVTIGESQLGRLSKDDLIKLLNEALGNEEYEKAARIRDELNKR